MKRYKLLPVLALLAALPALAGERVDRTLPAAADANIRIDNLAGSVEVVGWDRTEVSIQGTLGDDVEGLEVDDRGGRISIEVEIPKSRGRRYRDVDCDLEIRVPRGSRVEVETVSASIDVEGVNGRLELESVSGNVEVDGGSGALEVESVSGSIRITGSSNRVSAESVSGRVVLDGVSGRIEVSSVSGGVDVKAGRIQSADLDSVSGSIELSGSLESGGRIDANSHSGTIELRLPRDTSAEWSVSTFSGNIDNGFGPEAQRESRYTPSKSVDFTTGAGAGQISLETFSGNVRLRHK